MFDLFTARIARLGIHPVGVHFFCTVDLKVTDSLACYLLRYFYSGLLSSYHEKGPEYRPFLETLEDDPLARILLPLPQIHPRQEPLVYRQAQRRP